MNKPHVHAELIKKWADGAEIEVLSNFQGWQPCTFPSWMSVQEYRIKPEPESGMTDDELLICYYHQDYLNLEQIKKTGFAPLLRRVADEAVRRYVKENSNKS